jgi:hypothetical protein
MKNMTKQFETCSQNGLRSMNVHGFATTSHDGNKQQRFVTLPLKPNGQKTWVRTIEYHPIQQSPGMWPSEVR